LGAIVWAIIAIATNHEIGWVAWGIGAAAGGGMSLGYDDNSADGFIPGVLAALVALGGIVLGKIFIVVWVIFPMLAADGADEVPLMREIVAGNMAAVALQERRIAPAANEVAWDQEFSKAMSSLETVSDDEIEQRFETIMAQVAKESKATQTDSREQAATVELDQAWADAQPDAQSPSLIATFFSAMFGPMDAIFILLAFFTAYKIGSGNNSN
jgi:hypothetical protein